MNNTTDSASMIAFYVATPVGIQEMPTDDLISLFPNPTNGVVNLNIDIVDNLTIEIVNTFGAKVLEEHIQSNKIDLSMLSEGVYFYRLKAGNQLKASNIIVIQK